MTQIGSRVSESGASNDSIPNTSSPNEVEFDVDTSKKRKVMEPRATSSTSSNGTSSMNTPMRICPKFPCDTVDKGQNLINFPPSSMGAKEGVISSWKFDQAQSKRALAKMRIVDELPFSFVEKEGFKNFMRVTVSQFHIPSHRTVTRDCYELYLEERQLLKKDLDNVFTITIDNASSNDVTVKEMSKQLSNWGTNIMDGDHLHVRCMTHILNLIVQDGLKEIGEDGTSAKGGTSADILTNIEPDSDGFDILMWWKVNEPRFPILAEMARDVLAIPISSIALEYSLRNEPFPINIEQNLEYLEQLELVATCKFNYQLAMRGNGNLGAIAVEVARCNNVLLGF
ncbi:hypothetical protein KY290_013840 [Solanum tuberosum]|uniref:HAT C-terminal dimerisation domain-containing protein n=1 Tax=Solanum tuberosum TaxID=4113 RepID=A0ABQ7VQ44_SOLTU|nr:hypothetical protein KY289_013956 [Solanum tuberosum]KAH0769859.1 hypothetical protein KY290_013840 [Solanum tuberosum]